MIKSLLSTLFAGSLALASVMAQSNISDGFYRIRNYRTHRYIYVYDNTASIQNGTADLGALQLWHTADRRLSDPGTVVYIEHINNNQYDLRAQHTGVHELLVKCGYNTYLTVGYEGIGYSVSASQGGAALYLRDTKTDTATDYVALSTAANGPENSDIWTVEKISSTTDEFFGLTPTVTANGKQFAPFYADFAFSLVSSGMKVYYISKVDNQYGVAVLKEFTGDVVPASMPVYVECSSAAPTDNRLEVLVSDAAPAADNLLKGVYFNNRRRFEDKAPEARTKYDAATMRVLAADADGNLVYKTLKDTKDPYYSSAMFREPELAGYLAANQSYLKVAAGTPETLRVVTEEELFALSIEGIGTDPSKVGVFSLCGVRVANSASELSSLPAGLYIVNGKKVINRK